MRKTVLSGEQLNRVINLHQSGAKWLKIEGETGIPRRIAKREYENWQRDQALAELKEARKFVAAEAFHDHVNSLMTLAEALIDRIRQPKVDDIGKDANQFIDELWKADILKQTSSANRISRWKMPERSYLENRMLFDSLKEHTREDERWQSLDEWKERWNTCIRILNMLQEEIFEQSQNFFKQEEEREPGFLARVKRESGKKAPEAEIVHAVLSQIQGRIVKDDPSPERPVTKTMPQPDGLTHLTYYDSFSIILKLKDKTLAQTLERISNDVVKNIFIQYGQHELETLKSDIRLIESLRKKLEELLNPLVLKPIILRTRCKLCPA